MSFMDDPNYQPNSTRKFDFHVVAFSLSAQSTICYFQLFAEMYLVRTSISRCFSIIS